MMFKKGFSIPTILSLVLLVIVASVAIFRTVSLKRQADTMRKEGPKDDAAVQLLGMAFTTIQVMVLMTATFIILAVVVGSFIFSLLRDRQVSFLTIYWVAVFSPLVLAGVYMGASKVSTLITARAVGDMNQALPPAEVVEKAATETPAEKPAGVEGYAYPKLLNVF